MYTNRLLKIIIVDDDPQMREMLKDFFTGKYLNSDVSTYATGEEAFRSLTTPPSLIILDYHMDSIDPTAMNGLQVLKRLKDKYPDIPVIFLSGQEKAEVASNTMKYGAYDYIVKNESAFHRLEILVNNILGHVELKKSLGTQKFFNILLAIITLLLIAGILINRFS